MDQRSHETETQPDRRLALTLNGSAAGAVCRAGDSLAHVLREHLGLRGTKIGCNAGECGACTVLVDGRAVCACIFPAYRADGRTVVTIEGASEGGGLSPVQQALVDHGAFQCGYCASGMVMSLTALFDDEPAPDEARIRRIIQGNVCRCSGYVKIVEAALSVSARNRSAEA